MSDRIEKNENKIGIVRRLIEDEYLLVHIDPNKDGVVLPQHLQKKPTVTLKLSKLFRGGLAINGDTIETTLLFASDYIDCRIPLNAIWGVTSITNSNIIFPESAPPGLVQGSIKTSDPIDDLKERSTVKRPSLKRIK